MQFDGHAEKVEDRQRDQIEYVDEEPAVRDLFEAELANRGLTSLVPDEAYQRQQYEWSPVGSSRQHHLTPLPVRAPCAASPRSARPASPTGLLLFREDVSSSEPNTAPAGRPRPPRMSAAASALSGARRPRDRSASLRENMSSSQPNSAPAGRRRLPRLIGQRQAETRCHRCAEPIAGSSCSRDASAPGAE